MSVDPLENLATSIEKSAVGAIRTALGLYGLIALVVGVLILVWPGKTAAVVTAIIAIYAVLGGIAYAALGVFSDLKRGWARIGAIVLGGLFVLAGFLALLNLGASTAWLATFIAIVVGILWVIEGIVALTTLDRSRSRGWSIFFAIVSVLAGLVLIFSPLSIVTLWWLLGIFLVVIGALQIVRAFAFGRGGVVF